MRERTRSLSGTVSECQTVSKCACERLMLFSMTAKTTFLANTSFIRHLLFCFCCCNGGGGGGGVGDVFLQMLLHSSFFVYV